MNEPTREQLIDHFDSNRCWMSDCIGCKAIRKLIEQPAVTVEQICRWARFIWRSIPPGSVDVSRVNETQDNFIEQLKYILTELGIEVSKEVEP